MANELNYEQCVEWANAMPGMEHTNLRDLDEFEESGECNVDIFSDEGDNNGLLLSTKRAEGKLKRYFSKLKKAHVLAIGSSGSGKSQGFGANLLMSLNGEDSYIICDPKGEYYRDTYSKAEEVYGKENVSCMNFMQPELSDVHINFLCVLGYKWIKTAKSNMSKKEKLSAWGEIESSVRKYIDILFVVKSTKDPTWEVSAKNFITAIIFAMLEDLTLTESQERRTKRCRTSPEMINLSTVYKIFHSFSWGDGGYRGKFNDGGFFKKRSKSSLAYRLAQPIMDDAPSTCANRMGFVEQYLKPYEDIRIKQISSYNDFDITSLGRSPQVLYLIYDISDEVLRELVNSTIAQNLVALQEYTHKTVKPLDVAVIFFCDEFPALTPNPIYPNILATGRGSNLFLYLIIQSYTQLQSKYPTEYQSMIENCNYTFFVGTNEEETATKFLTALGKKTIPDPVAYLQGSFATLTVPVVTQDYLMHRMQEGEVFIKIHDRQPVHGHFEFFYKTEEYTKYPKTTKVPIAPQNISNCEYDAPWLHPEENDNDDDDDLF